ISGRVLKPDGAPAAGVSVMRAPRRSHPLIATINAGDRTRSDGTFTFTNVAPGEFTIDAIVDAGLGRSTPSAPEALWGTVDLEMSGHDIEDVVIRLQTPIVVRGRIGVSADAQPFSDFSRVQLNLTRVVSNGFSPGRPIIDRDGAFVFQGIRPGSYRLGATTRLDSHVFVQSVFRGGQDIIDAPFDIRAGDTITDIVVTVSGS